MEIQIVKIEDLIDELPEDEIEKLSTIDGVMKAEMLLAVTVALCEETQNYASQVFMTEDGRYLIIEARYTDGVTMTEKYAEMKAQLEAAEETLQNVAEIAALKDEVATQSILSKYERTKDGT